MFGFHELLLLTAISLTTQTPHATLYKLYLAVIRGMVT